MQDSANALAMWDGQEKGILLKLHWRPHTRSGNKARGGDCSSEGVLEVLNLWV